MKKIILSIFLILSVRGISKNYEELHKKFLLSISQDQADKIKHNNEELNKFLIKIAHKKQEGMNGKESFNSTWKDLPQNKQENIISALITLPTSIIKNQDKISDKDDFHDLTRSINAVGNWNSKEDGTKSKGDVTAYDILMKIKHDQKIEPASHEVDQKKLSEHVFKMFKRDIIYALDNNGHKVFLNDKGSNISDTIFNTSHYLKDFHDTHSDKKNAKKILAHHLK